MVRFPLPSTRLVAFLSFFLLFVSASAQKKQRTVPPTVEPRPFPIVRGGEKPVYAVEFRSADQISDHDRLLIANAESSIQEHAGLAGLQFQQTGWAYRQIVCPAFPNHLFLRYTRNDGAGDVSVFSASIPRNGAGRVRIVPILKRSYSLFSPAPVNALTISAFNHIRAEEGDGANSDWLGNALCYAALAGAQPEILPADAAPSPHKPIPALRAVMDVQTQPHGVEVIRFDDAAARPHAMQWTMTFTRRGRLIKAAHRQAEVMTANPVPQKPAVTRTRQVAQSGLQ